MGLEVLADKGERKGSGMIIDKERAQQAFRGYVSHYDLKKDMIRLKAEHTGRVSLLCQEIARSLELPEEDVDLAWLIGLLHDVGRFEQQKRYGTFNDAVSIDHAKYGARLLFGKVYEGQEGGEEEPKECLKMQEPLTLAASEEEHSVNIRDFLKDDSQDRLIWTAVFYHSSYRIPVDLDERTAMFCNIIRDADKIDILRVNMEFPLEQIYNVSTKELYNCQVSEEVMECFFEEHAVLRSLRKTVADHIVGHISLVFELVYPLSREIVKKQGYLDRMVNFRSDNPVTRQQFAQIRKRMDAR
nr:HD domain-containing protein [uncultured Acetatifactor sp.]